VITYAGDQVRVVEVRAAVPQTALEITMVREDTIIPERPFLAGPPAIVPRAVQAIGP
jgi:hypothetical protein